MKAVILAGGLGTRLSEETDTKPILWHIMKIYSARGVNDFVVCCSARATRSRNTSPATSYCYGPGNTSLS